MSVSDWTKTSAGEVRTASYCDDCVAAHPWVVMYGPILPTDDSRCDGCERDAAGPLNHVTMDWRLSFVACDARLDALTAVKAFGGQR